MILGIYILKMLSQAKDASQIEIEEDQVEQNLSDILKINDAVDDLKIGVVIHDATPDIFSKYQESSILLLTSRYEPFGLVLPEAMSCGLPVVAFDCPYGPSDIITDGVDGFLVKGRDVHVFAQKVSALIESQQMRVQMGREGIHSARRYEAERIIPMWVTLFRQLSEE